MHSMEVGQGKTWYILKSESKYGPFNYDELILMLQKKVLFDFDYLWSQGMDSWKSLYHLPEFGTEAISSYIKTVSKQNKGLFFKRESPRVDLSIPLFIHDNQSVWKGSTMTLSTGGAMLFMQNPRLLPGQTINVHFKQAKESSFNVMAEIVSKKHSPKVLKDNLALKYCVTFNHLNNIAEKTIHDLVYRKNTKKSA